ncbi:MAG TPA: hypothetical protein VFC44_07395 [Candidatus Saccharimonadales bacterium]|nr:hypothetical protein [Candidatus Saccharimonadales bacterium]
MQRTKPGTAAGPETPLIQQSQYNSTIGHGHDQAACGCFRDDSHKFSDEGGCKLKTLSIQQNSDKSPWRIPIVFMLRYGGCPYLLFDDREERIERGSQLGSEAGNFAVTSSLSDLKLIIKVSVSNIT